MGVPTQPPGAHALPASLRQEVLQSYGDILRVGVLRVNGDLIRWETDTCAERQLDSFCTALGARLDRELPEMAGKPDLRRLAYWVCKSLSINYVLVDVLVLLRQRTGALCTIETRMDRADASALAEYGIEVLRGTSGASVRASLRWRTRGNVVHHDPVTAEKKTKGTLSCLSTEFCLPPDPRLCLRYELDLRLRRSAAAQLASTLACGGRVARSCAAAPPSCEEEVCVEQPLGPLEQQVPLESGPWDCELPYVRPSSRKLSFSEISTQCTDDAGWISKQQRTSGGRLSAGAAS